MIKHDDASDKINKYPVKSIRTILTITSYIIFGLIWIFTANSIIKLLVKEDLNRDIYIYIESIFFIIVSAAGFYIAIAKLERYLYLSINRLKQSNENLKKAKERLHKQIEEINLKENALRISEERYRLASDGSQDGIWDLDLIKNELIISSRIQSLVGVNKNKFNSANNAWKEFIHPEDRYFLISNLNDYLQGKIDTFDVECRLKNKNDDYKWIYFRGKGIWDEEGNPLRIAGSITDITERKLNEQKIFNLAHYDQITGLPNRSCLYEKLNETINFSLKSDTNFIIFFIDLDDFKAVNDTLGHDSGDLLMKEVSHLLQDLFHDSFCARFGGDEFIVIKKIDSEKDNISEISKSTVNSLGRAWNINNHEFYISVSIGISIFPIHGTTPHDLIKNADLAMYTAKSRGKNTYAIYNSAMRNNLLEKFQSEKDLIKALENDEFNIH
ncbi:sensor domain-containing protein, partial [Clostridium polynesiense]|uniref:sensor domain-containing protein n=1 Tax=Clostridium polynesiense TaxID=1325933 RepID=UPI00058CE817